MQYNILSQRTQKVIGGEEGYRRFQNTQLWKTDGKYKIILEAKFDDMA